MTALSPEPTGRGQLRRAPLALLAAALLTSCAGRPPEPPRFTNLVLIVIDTLRSDHLAAYGYYRATAPFLDRLASQGVRLQGAAASSWTKPSVATLLTGLHPQRHRANTRADRLSPALPFLPAILKSHGFSTVGYTGNWFTGPSFGFDRGFDRFVDVWPPEPLRAEMYRNPASPDKPHASWATDSALELGRELEPPFFLSVHYLDPHDPYTPTATWATEPAPAGGFIQPQDLHPRTASEGQVHQLVDQYDAVIREVDQEVERLFQGLNTAGLLEHTLLIVTSDHGEEFLEHGNLTHGKTLFEEVLQVPLLFWSSDGLEPYGAETRFHHIDFLPTVLQALGIEVPETLDGVGRWRDVAAGTLSGANEYLYHLDLDKAAALALDAPPWKLVHQKRIGATGGEATATNLLFNLENDPGEHEHSSHEPAVREDLLLRLVARHNELSREFEDVENKLFDGALRRDLAGLGYLDASTPQEELERRNLPDQLRVFDSRTWGLFAGGTESSLTSSVVSSGTTLADRTAQLPRGVATSLRGEAVHWILLRSGDATKVTLQGEIQRGTGPLACELRVDGMPSALELTDGPFDRNIPLPSGPAVRGVVYLDLECALSPDGDDRLVDFASLAVYVE